MTEPTNIATIDSPDITHGPDMLLNAQVVLPRGTGMNLPRSSIANATLTAT